MNRDEAVNRNGAVNVCTTADYHTAGEPFRIVAEPPVDLPGATVAEKRMNAIEDEKVDGLRRLLCFEPRGHADMYGGFITEPDDAGAHFGVLFWHKDGFSTACGHGTMALGTWAIESGRVEADPSGVTDIVIDVPSGRVTASVLTDDSGGVVAVDFINVASRLIASGLEVEIEGRRSTAGGAAKENATGVANGNASAGGNASASGDASATGNVDDGRDIVRVDLAWGGAIYACVDGDALGLDVVPDNLGELIAFGREVKASLAGHPQTRHRDDDRLSGVYGTIIVNRLGTLPTGELHQRNVTIFADGQVDRSPCGSGTAARIAALHATGELRPGQTLVHDSIVGTRFLARVLDEENTAGGEAADGSVIPTVRSSVDPTSRGSVIPTVRGSAHKVATCTFEIDPADDLVPGFVLR